MAVDKVPRALTVAGSDSGGGAGIQADLRVFTVLGVYGMSAVTAITAQNTLGIQALHNLPADLVGAQIDAVAGDIGVDAVKTGMLSTPELVRMVAAKIALYKLRKLVVDPVMVAKGGATLLTEEARATLKDVLLPLALVVTPNVPEAEILAGMGIGNLVEMKEAARRILRLGPRSVVIKGGHLPPQPARGGAEPTTESVDVFCDGKDLVELGGPRFSANDPHGTGCTFSAAIAAELAKGRGVAEAVTRAKEFISAAVQHALDLGSGHRPTNPWAGAPRVEPSARGECGT